MLTVTIPSFEMYDSVNNEFITVKAQTLNLEHSLYSISKWEAKWKKPFIDDAKKTSEEIYDYIRCMTINKNVDPRVYSNIPYGIFNQIKDYMMDPMTATTFSNTEEENKRNRKSQKKITSEEIYWQMTALNIPFECDKWHFNRLETLIKICSIKNSPDKKMSKQQTARSNHALNAARRKASHSRG